MLDTAFSVSSASSSISAVAGVSGCIEGMVNGRSGKAGISKPGMDAGFVGAAASASAPGKLGSCGIDKLGNSNEPVGLEASASFFAPGDLDAGNLTLFLRSGTSLPLMAFLPPSSLGRSNIMVT